MFSCFSKALDTVPHNRLLHKLNYYGICGKTHRRIKNFLINRSRCVQVSGESSDLVNVSSGVPQRTVLGPLLFLVYVNDITCQINSNLKLFADDAVMYSEMSTQIDIFLSFQTDINLLSTWSNTWQINFNLTKSNFMTITRSTVDQPACYKIQKHRLENISSHKYLGIIIQDDLLWDSYVREVKERRQKSCGSCAEIFPTVAPRSKNRPITP